MIKSDATAYDCFIAALRHWLNKKGRGAQNSIAIESGVSQTLLSLILNPKANKRAGIDTQEAIIKAAGFRTYEEAIIFGRSLIETGNPPDPSPERPIIVKVNYPSEKDILNGDIDDYRGIPLYESGKLAAGMNGFEFDPYEIPASMVVVYKPELKGCSKHNLAALKVGGDSMEPTITMGSIVVVDLSDKEFFNRKVYVVNTPEGGVDIAAVKRVYQWKCGLLLVSDNHNYPPVPSELDWDILCVGRVVWMWRDIRDV